MRGMSKKRFLIFPAVILTLVLLGVAWNFVNHGHVGPATPGRTTTFYEGPFTPDGYVDYYAAYNAFERAKIKPEENAAIDMLLAVAAEKGVDIIRLANLCDDSALAQWLKDYDSHAGFSVSTLPNEASPYLPITSDWDELLASKPKKFRYKARKRAEAIDTQEALEVVSYDTEDECESLLEAVRAIEEHSWKQEAGHSLFDQEHERRYTAMLLPALARDEAMYADVLYKDGQPIAYNLCCQHKGWVGQMKTSFDARFSKLSPGSTLIDIGIRKAIARGASEFDFLGDADRHKTAWSKHIRMHSDFFLYLGSSFKARCLSRISE